MSDKRYAYVALSSDPNCNTHPARDPRFSRSTVRQYLPWLAHMILLAVSMSLFAAGVSMRTAYHRRDINEWDPLLGQRLSKQKIRFNGTFDRSSPFKGPPSPDVDKAWDSILPLHFLTISEPVFQTLNASKHAVKLPPSMGSERLGIFEAVHQIHCVRSLWKATYLDYYTEEREQSIEYHEDWRAHLDHCADILRQKLMCDADAGLVTYSWLKNHWSPHPNFNVQHKCRDYGELMEATEKFRLKVEDLPEGWMVKGDDDASVVKFEGEPPFDPEADG